MASGWPRNVVIVGEPGGGDTRMLREALKLLKVDPQVVLPSDPDGAAVVALRPDIVFFVLGGAPFGHSPTGLFHEVQPVPSLSRLWSLLANRTTFPVHVVVDETTMTATGATFTALHVVALYRSGAAGIWGINTSLLDDSVAEQIKLDVLRSYWQSSVFFLYGHPAVELYNFRTKVTLGWPTMEESRNGGESFLNDLQVKYCFQAALALAALQPEDLALPPGARPTDMTFYAHRLSELRDRTGLVLAASTLTQTLRYLERGWVERELKRDRKKKEQLPLAARRDGFPSDLPLVRDLQVREVPEALYDALINCDFALDWEPGPTSDPFTTLHRRVFR